MKKHIPNAITILNLICGCLAIALAIEGEIEDAAILVFAGAIFDVIDGLLARLLKVSSRIGVELDSLADVVTFGVVPGIIMHKWIQVCFELSNWVAMTDKQIGYISLLGFGITVFSAYRLAKFNVDDRQKENFIGLPTPANAIFIAFIPLLFSFSGYEIINQIVSDPLFVIAISVLSPMIMVSSLPMFSLKFKTWDVESNYMRYIFLFISLVAFIFFTLLSIPFIVLLYILLSSIDSITKRISA